MKNMFPICFTNEILIQIGKKKNKTQSYLNAFIADNMTFPFLSFYADLKLCHCVDLT